MECCGSESLSEYGYVENPSLEVEKFDDALIGLANRTRDGIALVQGMGNFGSPTGAYVTAHPMWRRCRLTKEGESLLKRALPGLPLVGSVLASAIKELSARKGRLVATAICRQLTNWAVGPLPHDALVTIENYAETGRSMAALKRSRRSLRDQLNRVEELGAERERSFRAEAEHNRTIGLETSESDEDENDRLIIETACIIQGLSAIESAATEKRYIWTAERAAHVFAIRSFGAPLHVDMTEGGQETMLSVRQAIDGIYQDVAGPKRRAEFNTRWRSQNLTDLANTMYQTEDSRAMPILGDALMDAGCDNEEVVSHCRSNGLHVRGCWVLDLILEKS